MGCAEASRISTRPAGEITLVAGGEGATSEGEFWEALNAACLKRLPLLFLIEDNGYAISVPVECQTAGGSISKLVEGFPGLFRQEVDGTDFLASYRAMEAAAAWCRAGQGPALVHAHVVRPYSHSLSDDERLYKTAAERAGRSRARSRDPLPAVPDGGGRDGSAACCRASRTKSTSEMHEATHQALRDEPPAPESALAHLYSETVGPHLRRIRRGTAIRGPAADHGGPAQRHAARRDAAQSGASWSSAKTWPIAAAKQNLGEVKGKGGVFKVTAGLQREFGAARSFNTPLAEAGIVGRAIGMATRGLKPVAEIQFFDYIWPAMMQIRDELATLRWRSNGAFLLPRCDSRAHRRIPERRRHLPQPVRRSRSSPTFPGCAWRCLRMRWMPAGCCARRCARTTRCCFWSTSGCIASPITARPHPGAGLHHSVRPRQGGEAGPEPDGDRLRSAGAEGAAGGHAGGAAEAGQRASRFWTCARWRLTIGTAIRASVEKTSRVMVAHEDCLSWGYGAEIAARIADELFDRLDAPVGRVGALDTWVGYHPQLEAAILPQTETLAAEMERLLRY